MEKLLRSAVLWQVSAGSWPIRRMNWKTFTVPIVLSLVATALAAEVQLGNEVLAQNGFKELLNKRIGLITNPSGVNGNLQSTIEVLQGARGVKLVALFGPEHGLEGDALAGDPVTNKIDGKSGVKIYSLYGKTRKPTSEMLKGLDALVYDLQDIGSRAYTFISTMGIAMDACAEAGIEFIVLDRPNPLGGDRIEGPMMDLQYRSFVGQWNIPYVYGMTCGELARMINAESWISQPCKLTVVPLKGWQRWMVWRDTGLPWVPTSPHIPNGDTPMYQVATGMLGEIGGLNIGIGYTLPFQCLAAPGLDARKLSQVMNGYGLPGVRFMPINYKPFYGAFHGQNISGVEIFVTDPRRAPLTALNFYAMDGIKQASGRELFHEAMKANRNFGMFDKVNGTDATRKALQNSISARNIVNSWKTGEDLFRQSRAKYLLY